MTNRAATTRTDADPTVVKVSGPADILGVLPYRLGFHPEESIVVVCLHGPRHRDQLVMRLDLMPDRLDQAVADDLAARAAKAGADDVVVVCYTAEPDPDGRAGDGERRLARAALVARLTEALKVRGLGVLEALLVRDGRWWSFRCSDGGCCPREGTPLPASPTRATERYAAEAVVVDGGLLLPDRETLERSVRPPRNQVADRVREQAVVAAVQRLVATLQAGGFPAVAEAAMSTLREVARRWAAGDRDLPPDQAAELLLALRDKEIRDTALVAELDLDPPALVAMWSALARCADELLAAPVCSVLAWWAYAKGDGALANVAVERALRAEPDYQLALLICDALDDMVPPAALRQVMAAVRAEQADQADLGDGAPDGDGP